MLTHNELAGKSYAYKYMENHKHVVHRNMVDGSSMIGFPLIIADIERDMPGSKPGPLGLHSYTDHKGRNKCGSVFLGVENN